MSMDCRSCLDTKGNAVSAPDWVRCGPERDTEVLQRWCRAVGPAVVDYEPQGASAWRPKGAVFNEELSVIVWNCRVGGGGFPGLWKWMEHLNLISDHGSRPFVLLLQEVFRRGGGVPTSVPSGAVTAGPISDHPPDPDSGRRGCGERVDVVEFARRSGLSVAYVPSMRNGVAVSGVAEDRGNAVLSNLPLRNVTALELPFERQRRVAVSAEVLWGPHVTQVCSVHLDNRAPWRRAWRSLGTARGRQMKGLLRHFPSGAVAVLGGDFNTWVGETREEAYREARRVFRLPEVLDPGATHHFEVGGVLRRSDHVMVKAPAGWEARAERGPDTFGSDHYPLLAAVVPPVAQ